MHSAEARLTVANKYLALKDALNERARRLWAATEAISLGRDGITCVSKATGIARSTIRRGIEELADESKSETPRSSRIRLPGGGRKKVVDTYPGIEQKLESLIEPVRGDPMTPLRWTCKSTRRLSEELGKQGYPVSPRKVSTLLRDLDYSLQANRKMREGINHPDRNEQFEYIYDTIAKFHRSHQPVISVDTKKKELLGDFSNSGREYRKKGEYISTRTHDFMDKELGKAVPYGVYDINSNEGWVSVGVSGDTSRFAANTILKWWSEMGHRRFPKASRIYITADAGGSNGWRTRLWKIAVQELATKTGLNVTVSHFPPGTSKWNKIEHRLFSFITQNWRGKPLYDLGTVVNLISSTTTQAGLTVRSCVDKRHYETGIKVTDAELAAIRLRRHAFHGEWNYTIKAKRR